MNIGKCRPGFKQCIETGLDYGFCQGEVLPDENEICGDLIDNNCNGVVDKDCMPACNSDQNCNIPNKMCQVGICQEGYCTTENLPSTTTFNLTPKDCKKEKCDGNGNISSVNDDTDIPFIDCYMTFCSGGKPISNPVPFGTSCSSNGGQACDGFGNCVECTNNSHCLPPKTCQAQHCI
jgi:hypothetical protein